MPVRSNERKTLHTHRKRRKYAAGRGKEEGKEYQAGRQAECAGRRKGSAASLVTSNKFLWACSVVAGPGGAINHVCASGGRWAAGDVCV
jgi:hypothetical protein